MSQDDENRNPETDNEDPGRLRTRERLMWLGLMAFFVVILAIYIARAEGLEHDVTEANRELLEAQMQLAEYTREEVPRPVEIGLRNADIQQLQRLGMTNPERRLSEDLVENPQLVPEVLRDGDTAEFREDGIYVLNARWVLAHFESGDRFGQLLLEYEVVHGNVMWEVVDGYVED
ncbi:MULTISPECIES: hypothetical protein [unclassified Thioalkalivibrio]|uniref:hypothetical protein n=1 Tax=unclassified Thioalkalivibrio TaxID=2621013 RepID=UPI000362FEFC|nr:MULTISPECIES: hypothetical protein [unclassified Thioalkalivibrio]